MNRRRVLHAALGVASMALARRPQAQGDPVTPRAARVIELTARRFTYEPSDIPIKVGERVVIAITAIDFVHGMNIPDLGKRLDLVPGRVTRLEFQPQAPGVIEFVCDNFCGDGHEQMHGHFTVSA